MNTNTAVATRQMTEDEVVIFTILLDAEKETTGKIFDELSKQPGGWVLKAIDKRFKAYNIKVDKKILITVLTMGNGVVGKCAMYVDDIVHWCKEKTTNEIDFKTFYEKIYPNGFPDY